MDVLVISPLPLRATDIGEKNENIQDGSKKG
jgi:hypothetical protein